MKLLCVVCHQPLTRKGTKRHRSCGVGKYNNAYKLGKCKAFVQLSKDGKVVTKWDSLMQLERVVGGRRQHVRDVCQGRRKTAYGFIWRYV